MWISLKDGWLKIPLADFVFGIFLFGISYKILYNLIDNNLLKNDFIKVEKCSV